MYGRGSQGYRQDESEDEYDVFAEVERERVVKTYSKESATSKMQWNTRQEQEQLKSFKDLALVGNDPTKEPRRVEATFQKNLHHRQNGPAGVLFSTFGSSAASHDTSSRLDSSSAGHAGSFASSNNFMGNKDVSPTSQKEDSESAYSHFSSGIGESFSEQQHRHNKDNSFPVTLSRMSIGAAYGAMKNMKSNQN